jgi:hypothetical protein
MPITSTTTGIFFRGACTFELLLALAVDSAEVAVAAAGTVTNSLISMQWEKVFDYLFGNE